MEVRIGVIHTGKEIRLEVESPVEELESAVSAAIGGTSPVLWLTDKDGHRLAVAADKIAWVEMETGAPRKSVGFGPG